MARRNRRPVNERGPICSIAVACPTKAAPHTSAVNKSKRSARHLVMRACLAESVLFSNLGGGASMSRVSRLRGGCRYLNLRS